MQDVQALCNSGGGANKAVHHWYEIFGTQWRNPGNTRWWAKWETVAEIDGEWDCFEEFVLTGEGAGDMEGGVRIARLRELLSNPVTNAWVKLEAGVVALVGKPLVQYTYILETDGAGSVIAHEAITSAYYFLHDHQHDPVLFPGMREKMEACTVSLQTAGIVTPNLFDVVKAEVHLMRQILNLKFFEEAVVLGMETEWKKYVRACKDLAVEEEDGKLERKMRRLSVYFLY
eukprot:gene23735-29991_t